MSAAITLAITDSPARVAFVLFRRARTIINSRSMTRRLAKAAVVPAALFGHTVFAQGGGNAPADGECRIRNQFTGPDKVLAVGANGNVYLAARNDRDDSQVRLLSANQGA